MARAGLSAAQNYRLMTEVRFEPTDTELFAFNLYTNKHKVGEILVGIQTGELRIYHTFLSEPFRGKGHARALLNGLLRYCRSARLRISSVCPYATRQLRLYPDLVCVEFVPVKLAYHSTPAIEHLKP